AHAVITAVLGEGGDAQTGLAPTFAARLRADVLGTPITRALRGQARKRQLELRSAARPSRAAPTAAANAQLPRALLRVDLTIDLQRRELRVGPIRHPALRAAPATVRAAPLRERRPTQLAGLASSGATLSRPPSEDAAPLFAERWTADLKGQLGVVARGLWVSGQRPLVFTLRGSAARQQLDRGFGASGALLVLHPAPLPDAPGVSVIGQVAGEWLHQIDLSDAAARDALRGLGLEPQAAPIAALVGLPPRGARGEESYAVDDVLGLVVARGAVTLADADGAEATLAPGAYRLGRRELRAAARREGDPAERALSLEVRRGAAPSSPPVITAAGGRPPTLAALFARQLGLVVHRPVGAVGLRLRLSLVADDAPPRRAWTTALGPLPAAVAPDDPAWGWLARAIPHGGGLRLRAELPGLAVAEWPLHDGDPEEAQDAGETADAPNTNEGAAPGADPCGPAAADDGLPPLPSHAWRLDALAADAPLHTVEGAVALIGLPDGLFGPRGQVVAPRAAPLATLRRPPPPALERSGPAVLEGFSHLWRWARADAPGGVAMAARAAAVTAWERALIEATCGAAWADAEAAALEAAPHEGGAERAAAEALLAPGVAWHEGQEPPPHSRPRAVGALSMTLQGRLWGERSPNSAENDALLNMVSGWIVDALVHAGAARDELDPPAEPAPTWAALDALWRRRPRRTIPWSMVRLLLPQSHQAELERALREAPALAAAARAVEGVAGRAPWGEQWTAPELELLARLWLAERPPQWGRDERALVVAVTERAAVDPRGARLSRIVALSAAGRLGIGGAR
ncbi:MAG: hypothetical protein JNM72_25170, partial [Deltaproteobacteria bacterium]|nr:hypothetical protein [Deltaproteobacteria bacterium]